MATKIEKQIPISEVRANMAKYFNDAGKNPVVVSLNRGKDTRVILNSKFYNELIDAYEDKIDAEEMTILKKTHRGAFIPWNKIKKEMKL